MVQVRRETPEYLIARCPGPSKKETKRHSFATDNLGDVFGILSRDGRWLVRNNASFRLRILSTGLVGGDVLCYYAPKQPREERFASDNITTCFAVCVTYWRKLGSNIPDRPNPFLCLHWRSFSSIINSSFIQPFDVADTLVPFRGTASCEIKPGCRAFYVAGMGNKSRLEILVCHGRYNVCIVSVSPAPGELRLVCGSGIFGFTS